MKAQACAVEDEELWDLLDGSAGERAAALRAHVATCAACAERLERLERLHGGLASMCRADPPPLPEAIGPYRIVRVIGEGGMGVVYEAEQPQPVRRVAVKVMRPVAATDERSLRAFRREIQALGRLRHPGLVTIHDAGRTEEGQLYLVMELVDGEPLDRWCRRRALPLEKRVELCARVADAVHHVHERGVMHRDLKPSNVLVDADGAPRLLDFGLARFLRPDRDGALSQSVLAAPVGTMPYMSPEQLGGGAPGVELDARTDVYSLGVILYELLTGNLPYRFSRGLADALRTLAETTPAAPTALAPGVPRELGDVVMKAIAQDRAQRYGSARALADDLRRFLSGEAVTARPPRLGYRLRVFLRRRKAAVAVAAAVAASGLVVFFGLFGRGEGPTTPIQRRVPLDVPEAVFALPGWGRQFDFSSDGAKVVYAVLGRAYVWERSTSTSRPIGGGSPGGASRWRYQNPRWSPDGQRVASSGRRRAEVEGALAEEWGLFVLDPRSEQLSQVASMSEESVRDLCWTPDGRALTCAMGSGELRTVSLAGGTTGWRAFASAEIGNLGGYSPDGRWLLFDAGPPPRRPADVWIMPSGGGRGIQLTFSPATEAHPTWSPDGRAVWFVADRGERGGNTTNLWKLGLDPETGQRHGEPEQFTFHEDQRVLHPKFLDNGRDLAYAAERITTKIWSTEGDRFDRGTAVTRGKGPLLSPDGATVYFTGGIPGQPGLFAILRTGGAPRPLVADIHSGYGGFPDPGVTFGPFFDVAPDGSEIVYPVAVSPADAEKAQLRVVATSGGRPRTLAATDAPVAAKWSPDGKCIAYIDGDGLFVIAADGSEPRRKLAQLYRWEARVHWSPGGASIAALGYATPREWPENDAVFVVTFPGGELRRVTPPTEAAYKEGLRWHPGGGFLSYVYYGDDDRKSQIRCAYPDGRPTEVLIDQPGHWDYVGVWAPDGRRFFFQSDAEGENNATHIYDLDQRQVVEHGVAGLGSLPQWSRRGEAAVWTTNHRVQKFEIMRVAR